MRWPWRVWLWLDTSALAIYPTEPVTITATVSNATTTAVTWSLSGTNCTGSACGTLTPTTPAPTPATAAYVAPPTPTSGVTVTATLAADSTKTGTLSMNVIDVTTYVAPAAVAPATLSVGKGLTQTFTAVAVPDAAGTQTFTWSCTAGGSANNCANFHQDANVSGLAYYTAADACNGNCVQISASATLDPTACSNNPKNCTIAKFSQVPSRVSGTYAFQFSGHDSNNKPTAVAGTFTASNGTITSGVEDELTSIGASTGILITGGLYKPNMSDANNSNNAGTLTLTLPAGVYPNQYQVVLDGAGHGASDVLAHAEMAARLGHACAMLRRRQPRWVRGAYGVQRQPRRRRRFGRIDGCERRRSEQQPHLQQHSSLHDRGNLYTD